MKEYFITVMAVALMGGVVISLVPEGKSVRYVRLLCGLCTVGCIAFPIADVVGEGLDKDGILSIFDYEGEEQKYYEEIYNKNLDNAEIENAEITLKSEIIKELNAEKDEFDLKIITDIKSDEIYISSVQLVFYKNGLNLNPRTAEKIIFERLGCPTEIFYDI